MVCLPFDLRNWETAADSSLHAGYVCESEPESDSISKSRVQPTVTFPIGDHVNVLYDYKKTGPSKILKRLTCHCHHLIDMLIEFSQSLKFLIHLKCLNVPYP